MGKKRSDIWQVQGIDVPVHIYVERRRGKRVSITKTGVNIRIPSYSAKLSLRSDLQWARDWVDQQTTKAPDLLDRFKIPDYANDHTIHTPTKEYKLRVTADSRATSTGKLNEDEIVIHLNDQLNPMGRAKTIRTVAARIIGKDQYQRISSRIHEINNDYFQQTIKDIRIKNNSSNWGSCSNSGNINISIKTLLAPLWVQDYIFVHELSHRLEMNHSKRYWAIVSKVMPEYEKAEAWIKQHGNTCEI